MKTIPSIRRLFARRPYLTTWTTIAMICAVIAVSPVIGDGLSMARAEQSADHATQRYQRLDAKTRAVVSHRDELADKVTQAHNQATKRDKAALAAFAASHAWQRYTKLERERAAAQHAATSAEDAESDAASKVRRLRSEYQTDQPWYPQGYTVVGYDSDVAMQWIHDGCSNYFGYCWKAAFVTQYGCSSSLYAEVSISSGGSQVDWSNDLTGALSPREVAYLEFDSYEDGYGSLSAHLSDLTCY